MLSVDTYINHTPAGYKLYKWKDWQDSENDLLRNHNSDIHWLIEHKDLSPSKVKEYTPQEVEKYYKTHPKPKADVYRQGSTKDNATLRKLGRVF